MTPAQLCIFPLTKAAPGVVLLTVIVTAVFTNIVALLPTGMAVLPVPVVVAFVMYPSGDAIGAKLYELEICDRTASGAGELFP
jgi:hypothetical protein